jgi:hypothetical protein
MSANNEMAFTAAGEVAKQLITLATGILALTITFAKDLTRNTDAHRAVLIAAWIIYLISLLGGVWTLMALAGSLAAEKQSIYGWNIRLPAILQVLLFLTATLLIILYAALSLGTHVAPTPTK